MLRPTRLTAAQGPMISTRHSSDSSASSAARRAASSVLAPGSSDTVTFVSEVDTRSTDMPWSLKTAKASARKPTWCHMPGLSIETSVMPFLRQTAFTCAAPSPGAALITRALEVRHLRRIDEQRDAVLHAPAGCSADAAPWRRCWRSPGPRRSGVRSAGAPWELRGFALNMPGTSVQISSRAPQLRGEVGARGVRAAAAQQHRVALGVAGDETLRDAGPGRGPRSAAGGPGRARSCRSPTGSSRAARGRAVGLQHRARVDPRDLHALRAQERGADPGRHQFADRHHPRAHAVADLADQVDALGDLPQVGEVTLEVAPGRRRDRARDPGGDARSAP